MFNNRFNSSKNDPLLEAVKAARADGDARRLAESMANDLFGVFSRKAVVREHLSDYDFALEEAYKCMSMKEEDKMADKDYDRDGKIETSKKEVWGSRLRAAKASGKYKGPVDEKKMWEGSEDTPSNVPPSDAAQQAAKKTPTPPSTPAPTKSKDLSSTFDSARGATGMQEEKWIQAAIKKKGSLSKKLGVPEKKNIPLSKLSVKPGDTPATKKQKILAKTLKKLHKEDVSFNAAQETGKSVNEVAMGVPPAITPPVISRPAKSTSGLRAPTGSFRGLGADPMKPSSTQVNFSGVKPSAGYDVTQRMSASGRAAAASKTSSLGGMNAADRIGGAIKSATSSPSAKAMVDNAKAAISRGVGALGTGGVRAGFGRMAGSALGPGGAVASLAAPYVAGKMAASHKAGHSSFTGAHQQTPDVKASDSFARMKQMTQTSTASSTPAATAASKPAIDPTAKGAKYAGGTVHNVTTLKQTAPGDQAQIQSVKTEKGWADPGRWENEVRSKTGAMQQIRTDPKRHVVDTATQQVGRQSASDEKSTSNFLQSQGVGTSSQSQDTPATPDTTKASVNINKKAVQENDEKIKAPKPLMTTFSPAAPMGNLPKMSDHPPSSLKESVTVGKNKYRIV